MVFRPDANTCVTNAADVNPNLLIGNNIGDPFFFGTSSIILSAEPGTGLSNTFYNAGGGDVAIPIAEASGEQLVPCALSAACNVTLFFTYDGTDYSIDITSPSGSNTINGTAAPTVVPPADATPPTVTSISRQPPATATTSADTLVFRVVFSEDVQNVTTADFDASGTTGDASAVSSVDAATYDVTVSGGDLASYNGSVGLTFNAGQDVQDLAGNALSNTTPGSNQTYTVTNAPEISVSSSVSGAVADGGTDAQGSRAAGSPVTVTYTVTNSGTDALTLSTATSSSASNVVVGTISAPGSSSVAAGGGSTTFTVQYTPTVAGAFSFDLSMVNGDADESPYNITVSGTATGAPEISVSSSVSGAVADGGTDAQGSRAAGSPVTVTYTVTNSGTDALTLSTATSSSASNVVVGTISAPGSSSVAAGGGSTTFTVQYTPTVAGAFSFDLSMVNGDGDESPYNITVSGTATGAPEISVSSSVSGAVADGGTDAQGSRAAGSPVTVTYTVTNSGTDALTLSTATSSSASNVVVGTISAPGSSSVAAGGGSTTFTVQYTPTVAGAFSFDLSMVNGDADESPYNITVSGTATGAPEISVSSSVSGAVADGGTDAQGSRAAGSPVTVTYTVTNSGTDALTLSTATSSSASNVVVGTISAPGSSSVAAGGGSTTFTVQYTPTVAGAFSFDLSMVNGDGDESPYNITVSGTATGTPEISVSSSVSGAVADGGTDAQGSRAAGSPVTVTYTVTNSGTDALTLSTATSSSASNVVVGTISAPGSSSVAAGGGSTTFTVQYTPTVAGAFSFDLSMVNGDGDESPYNITVSGTATGAPEISVSSSVSGAVADGGTDAQGSRAAGSPVTVTYTVTNSGTDALSLSTATSSSASNVVVGTISAPGSSSVAAGGGSTTFTVQYTPTVAGAFSFDLAMVNGDGDENPYNITVSGTATGAPEISVSSSESGALADGGTDTVSTATAQGVTSQITYTISNGGTDVLTLTTPTVATAVSASSNVTVSALTLASTMLAPGNSTTLVVDFAPTAGGAFGFTLSLANNDPDEAPFDILVSGSAAAAPTVVLSGAPSTLSGGGNFDVTATFSEPVTGFVAADVNVSNGTVAGLSGSGASYTITITPTGGDVSISIPAGIASSASTGALNEASASTTIADQTAAETEREIATFLNTRANLLIGNQPDLRSIVFGGASGGFTLSSKSEQLNFALNSRSGAPLWFQLQGARSNAGDRKADYLFGAFGGHTWVNDRVAVGAMLQVDKIEQRNGPLSIEGRGWLVGPYVAARAAEQPLFFEAYLLYGQSENDISPFGTYTDQFDTERWLLHTAVTGEVQRGKVTYFPSLSATYTTDDQRAYTDSLGNPIAAQRLEYGQIALGLDFETPLGDGRTGWSLQGGLQGSYAFKSDSGGSVPISTDYEGGSGRVELGVSHLSAAGGRLELSGFYDGIGAAAYEVYGLSLRYDLDF
ncbi:hypothetical protein TL5120_03303 [Thalassovita autumnalis]|uniref:Autotransporter domain-containing protein n=1 Tax=Thalassovita autumnalis TaxID=2072972 RepID=A0A0P1GHB4_9RHOB|nr:choice-of-anchor D domain-containing protein [Thalassovita autumnalis]CUH73493.1 hypothetical protein TL5120_03303 [Thalassovita autumnalis]